MSFKIGQKVKREIDVFNKSKGLKFGTVIRRYSQPEIKYSESLISGPYPELYEVQWDSGIKEKGFLPHGLSPL